jgi:hypothetical protein
MRISKILLLLFLCLMSNWSYTQTPKSVEAGLLRKFRKIKYWSDKRADDKTYNPAFEDSLAKANTDFGKLLQHYSVKFPAIINQKFTSLTAEHLKINSSDDNLFRIYSWDTETGGTMHFFDNVFQYKSDNHTKSLSVLDTRREGDTGVSYDSVYTFKSSNKTYYLCVFMFVESTKYYGKGITVFSIENGELRRIKLLKTDIGLDNGLSLEYAMSSTVNWKTMPEINFNKELKIINIPYVDPKGTLTNQFIHYKFTGQYFEKVKS